MSRKKPEYWTDAPRLFDGRACALVGGGPSVTVESVEELRRAQIHAIAINNSYHLAPWADVLYFCDLRWWGWHKDRPEFKAFEKRAIDGDAWIATLENVSLEAEHIQHLRNTGRDGIDWEVGSVRNGANGGYQAINLAIHLGAKYILLLGFDMSLDKRGKSHWHDGHPVRTPETVYQRLMIPAFDGLARALDSKGIVVHNCSATSALKAFPYQPLAEAICHAQSTYQHSQSAGVSA